MKHSSQKMLTGYSLLSAAFMQLQQISYAEIIYFDADGIWAGDLDLDIDGDGKIDFNFWAGYGGATTYSGFWNSSGQGIEGHKGGFSGDVSNQIAGFTTYGYFGLDLNAASNLNEGELIGPENNWLTSPLNEAFLCEMYSDEGDSHTIGNFHHTTGFVGIKFKIGTTLHYGWLRISDCIKLEDYAYQSNPDQPIMAGQLVEIDLSNLNSDQINIYYSDQVIQIINSKFMLQPTLITIYNLDGEAILQSEQSISTLKIDVSGLPKGDYFVKIKSKEEIMVKQILIY